MLCRNSARRLLPALALAPTLLAAAPAAAPAAAAAAAAQPRALVAFLPGDRDRRIRVLHVLAARRALAVGLLSATQGPYDPRQALLDMSQGSRVSLSGYDGRPPPVLRLVPAGRGGRIAGWDAARFRARRAPGDLRPGLLAASVPGGAAFAGMAGTPAREAALAADRAGRVAAVSLGSPDDVDRRARRLARRHALVVVALPGGAAGRRALDRLLAARGARELLLVVRRPPDARDARLLSVGVAGAGQGLVRSGTTRRAGLVAGIDVLPTVLEHLGRPMPAGVDGRPIMAEPPRDLDALAGLEHRLEVVSGRRFPALGAALGAWFALLAGLALAGGRAGVRRAGRIGALAALWLPTVSLALAALDPEAALEYAGLAVGGLALGAATDALVPWPRGPAVPGLLGVLAHAADLFGGSDLIIRSLLGPNPRFGARFYGIGNELEATLPVLALAGLAAAAGARPPSRRLALVFGALMLALGLVLGAARLGADVGGVMTVGAGGAAAVLVALPGVRSHRALALALLTPLGALGALAAVDLATGGDAHFTRTVLGAERASDLVDVAARRYELAWDALVSGVMPLAAALAVALLVLGLRRRARLFAAVGDAAGWRAGLWGTVAATVAGALFNDSGPMLLLFGTFLLAWLAAYLGSAPVPGKRPPYAEGARG